MARIYDGSLKDQIIKLRLKGITNKQICIRLGCNPSTCRVIWWQYNNPKKCKEARKKYYQKHKEAIKKYHYAWAKRNPDLYAEYWWRHKCNKAGVDWRKSI